jgi:signal transduction histidine kinase
MRSRRVWWGIYSACAGTLLLGLIWITFTVVRLEQAELNAQATVRHQESMRLALWRLDSWMMPHLARESGRPFFEYQSFYSQGGAYARLLQQVKSGDDLTPSPLLTFSSDFIQLHFQMSPTGALTSPQVPVGDMRIRAEAGYLSASKIGISATRLTHLGRVLRAEKVVNCMTESESQTTVSAVEALLEGHVPPLPIEAVPEAAEQLSRQEWAKRKGSLLQNIKAAANVQAIIPATGGASAQVVDAGPFVPLWIAIDDEQTEDELVFVRRVRVANQEYYQGFLCNWPALRTALLSELSDLSFKADLVPMGNALLAEAARGAMLATAPLLLHMVPPVAAALPWLGPIRATIALTWLAVIAGLVAVALNLRQSITFGEKRSRFASAVTHELRTPLTTFRLYTEMLADGMVQEPDQRQIYLNTLKDESGRLAALVENVLAYAQLEEGRRTKHQIEVSIDEAISRLQPQLERRATDSEMNLQVADATPDGTTLHTDVDALGQVLFNLVDNACKYAKDASDCTIQLKFTRERDRLKIAVRDYGPGVAQEQARLIFDPFERGTDVNGDQPGIGLGLALSRSLARDLGGDLTLSALPETGACFVIDLPLPASSKPE